MHRSASGLMDAALPAEQQQLIAGVLDRYAADGIVCRAVRTRQAGRRSFVSFEACVPGAWPVREAHGWMTRIERDLVAALPGCEISAHLVPDEDAPATTPADDA